MRHRERFYRGALVGAGSVSRFHLAGWERIDRANIVAIADPKLENAQARASQFEIPKHHVYSSLSDLLEKESGLDFVDLATPPESHLGLVRIAAEKGLAINCQKPFALNLTQALEMIRASQKVGVLLNVNENWRWRSWYRQIKEMLQEGRIGSPVYARFFLHTDSVTELDDQSLDEHSIYRRPYGTFMEWGIHHVDVMRFLFGEPCSLYMRTTTLHPELSPVEERAVLVLNFNSLTALLDMSISSYAPWGNARRGGPMVEDVRIEADRGSILLIPDPRRGDRLRLVTQDEELDRPAYPSSPQEAYQSSYSEALSHFIHCLDSGQQTETNAMDNLKTLAVVLAAYESARQNSVIEVASFLEASMGTEIDTTPSLPDDV
jgi:predicted dehydrogenase